jgi:tagatose 6-phosphate kinase
MIKVICLNPAVDRIYHLNGFCHGEKYFGNIPQISAGGKGINVARAVASLGEPVEIRGFIGGANGEIIRGGMELCGCKSDWTLVTEETRTTINIVDNQAGKETEIIEAGYTPDPLLVKQFVLRLSETIVEHDIVICSGLGFPEMCTDMYREISHICQSKKASCFLDTTGPWLEGSLGGSYAFAKPNKQEILSLYGVQDANSPEQLCVLAGRLRETGIDRVMVSLGSKGALFMNGRGTWYAKVPAIRVCKTIGCGDCAVAGYAAAFSRGMSSAESLRYAMACGVANSMEIQPCNIKKDQIDGLLEKIEIAAYERGNP